VLAEEYGCRHCRLPRSGRLSHLLQDLPLLLHLTLRELPQLLVAPGARRKLSQSCEGQVLA
jgi:hypothetical protein